MLSAFLTACLQMPFSGSSKTKTRKSNLVTNDSKKVDETIIDGDLRLRILSEESFELNKQQENVISPVSLDGRKLLDSLPQENRLNFHKSNPEVPSVAQDTHKNSSLLVGFPIGLVGQQNIFGGVITKVSDKESEDLGGLKLTDLPPLHVRTKVSQDPAGNYSLVLVGCVTKCGETSDQSILVSFPIVGVDKNSSVLFLDLASLGQELNLVSMLDPQGEYTQLKTIASVTSAVDFSYSTLVFDVLTTMIPVTAQDENPEAPRTEFTVRWYLKLNSAFNPAFDIRLPTQGVGFFQTERSKTSKITRFSTSDDGSTVHYYLKNIPKEFRDIFSGALDNWNAEFKKIIGRELLSYEFLELDDPRTESIIAGDIRYNVIEWDLENRAGYGGLGPSIANQFTGEIISANVLIQGPHIIKLYTKWFQVSEEVRELRSNGLFREANFKLKAFDKEFDQSINKYKNQKFILKLGDKLELNVRSQKADLEDPIYKGHFELVPVGVSFQEYMTGYFTEMLEHEIGHNLGLRHNFKGNLGAIENGEKGSVSRSIMEYLGRPYRHLNMIGLYDRMAISYGYAGVQPRYLNWFCTDEDQPTTQNDSAKTKSPECSKSDATSDPFSFWESRLQRAIDLLVETKSKTAPIWTYDELKSNVEESLLGLAAYALSSEKTLNTWTNFFGKANRPESPSEIKDYVLNSLKTKLCNPKIAEIISSKETPAASELARKNLEDLKMGVAQKTAFWELYNGQDLGCQ